MHEALRRSDFQPFLRQMFSVRMEGAAPVEIELLEIDDRNTAVMESFALLFRGPKDRVFQQNSYRLSHPGMGEFILFLGPVAVTAESVHYEAIFTRLASH
jgi:hypothetical protein